MRNKTSIEEIKRRNKARQIRFVQLGFRPLQIALCTSLLVYVFSMFGAILYNWKEDHFLGLLIMPALLVVSWSTQFGYGRNQFMSSSIVTAFTILFDYRHLIADNFNIVGTSGRIMVVLLGFVIYSKMQDPIFSRLSDAA
jgi:hypothetical protein